MFVTIVAIRPCSVKKHRLRIATNVMFLVILLLIKPRFESLKRVKIIKFSHTLPLLRAKVLSTYTKRTQPA